MLLHLYMWCDEPFQCSISLFGIRWSVATVDYNHHRKKKLGKKTSS